jgi:chromosome segregation ATPase
MDLENSFEEYKNKVKSLGFWKKVFTTSYDIDTVEKAFKKGYSILVKKVNTLTEEVKTLTKKKDTAEQQLELEKQKLQTSIKDKIEVETSKKVLDKEHGELKQKFETSEKDNKELKKTNATLVKNNGDLNTEIGNLKTELKKLAIAQKPPKKSEQEYVDEIKTLKKAIEDVKQAAAKDKSKALKECTDDFMKKYNKLDKEHQALLKKVEKSEKPKTTKPVAKKETAKATTTSGRKNGQRALDCPKAVEIRRRVADGEDQNEIAKEFEVDPTTISRLIAGKTYKNCK